MLKIAIILMICLLIYSITSMRGKQLQLHEDRCVTFPKLLRYTDQCAESIEFSLV